MTTMPTTGPVTGSERAPGPLRMTPGRWVALLLGVPIALTLIGWTGFSFVSGFGTASFPVSASIPLQNGRLVASLDGADVTLHEDLTGGNTARLVGKVQYSLIRPRFTVSGTDVSLHCRLFTGNCGLAANLDVPAHTAVDLTTGGGSMQLSDIQNDLTLNTGGGDVSVNDLLASNVKIDTGGGDINLVFTKVPTSLTIESSGGDISVVLPHSAARYAIDAQTGGGNYSAPVPTNSAAPNAINIQSGGGDVSITEAS